MNVAQCLTRGQMLGLPRLEAQILFLHAAGRSLHDRAWLLAHDTDEVLPEHIAAFEGLAQRRLQLEPIAYIVGQKEFFGLNLAIDKRVLDPRADTEVLVDWALACGVGLERPRYLDLGTGSGAIALAVKSQLSEAEVLAVDNSAEALSLAAQNAQNLALNVSFLQSNWFSQVQGKFNVLVSNPPYIEDHDTHLAMLTHEPLQALASGPDGLEDIKKIVQNAPNHLEADGWLLLEHGWKQATAVRGLLEQAGFKQVQSKLDLAGIERCSGGQK